MGDGIAKKRKRNGAEPVVNATALSKKSKKAKNPVPKLQPQPEEASEDEESAEEDEDVEEDSVEDERDEAEEESGDEDENNDDAADDTVGELPTDGAPILPPTTDSELFEQLKLSDKTMKAIGEMGFTKMTAIQKVVRTDRRR